jgi:8-oxo-dGTP diphosphatase
MTTPLATDLQGNTLIDLAIASIDQLEEAARHTPCPLSLVVLVDESTGGVLFGRNRWRQEYELPGGMVEEGESYFDAARRELEEESTIRVGDLELIGFARFSLVNPLREELGAIYFARVTDQSPQDSNELDAFVWRRPLSASTLAISPLDDTIAHWSVGVH